MACRTLITIFFIIMLTISVNTNSQEYYVDNDNNYQYPRPVPRKNIRVDRSYYERWRYVDDGSQYYDDTYSKLYYDNDYEYLSPYYSPPSDTKENKKMFNKPMFIR